MNVFLANGSLLMTKKVYCIQFAIAGWYQGANARKVNCGRVYSAYILKPVLSGRNL